VTGPDGNLWFAEAGGKIGEINPATHAISEFTIPTTDSDPHGITVGPDGNIWFTEFTGDKIGQINPTTHAIAQFPIPAPGSHPVGIIAGPDGNLWFAEETGNKIGEIDPTTHVITEFAVPTPLSIPEGITAGPDGNLWFTEADGDRIGEINPTTHAIAEFLLPTSTGAPVGITTGPDGNLWFTDGLGNNIGQINPTTHAIVEFAVPTPATQLGQIAAGLDGNLWFTEEGGTKIGQINPATHAITEFLAPTPSSIPTGITAGPDGNIWFTEQSGNIGEVVLQAAPTAPDLALTGNAPGSLTLGNDVTYTLTVTNNGTASATGVTLSDTLPAGATFVSATDGVTPVNGVLTFSVGNLNAGASASFTIVDSPTAAGTLTDQASVSGSQGDPTPADNSVTLTTSVTPNVTLTPDLALSGDAPSSVTLGSNVTDTLTVTNNGTAGATGVILTDTLPAGVTFDSATDGVTPVAGVLTFNIGNLAAGASLGFNVVFTPQTAGTFSIQSSVNDSQNDSSPSDNSLTQRITVRGKGPSVTGVQRFGFHGLPTTLVLTFDELLDPARAQNPANYEIVALDGPRRSIRVRKAVYDAATRTVTLNPEHRLNLHHRFRLTVVGTGQSGVADISGNLLDGQDNGDLGSNYVTIVTAKDLVLTTTDPRIVRAYRKLISS
jgi:virginiamycin B lyase